MSHEGLGFTPENGASWAGQTVWVEKALDTASRSLPRHATVKVRNAAALVDTLEELGADPAAILRRAGIEPGLFANPDNDLPYSTLGRLVGECVRETGCEAFGLRVGARTEPTAMGLTGLVSLHASTVREALMTLAAGLKTSDTGGAAILSESQGDASFGYVVTAPDVECADQIVDAAMAIVVNTMRSLCGPTWRPVRVRLTRDPPGDGRPFSNFFAAPVEYGAPAAAAIFEAATLDAPVRNRNPHYAEILAPLHDEAIANAQDDFVSAVRSVIRSRIGAGALSRDSVCRVLGLNARSFARRLEAQGVTYSGLADQAKYEAAQSLLMKDRRIAEIASVLGFAEQSAFTRAFKAWSGTTPARWRAARGGG